MMLQLYSMPLLAYGVGSWLMSRSNDWGKIRNALIAHAIFTGAEFFASLRFFNLLDGPTISVALWLGALALMTCALIGLSIWAIKTRGERRRTIAATKTPGLPSQTQTRDSRNTIAQGGVL
jgi:hypothetical protein